MDFLKFEQKLAASQLAPLYLIVGQETFFKSEALRLIQEKSGPQAFFRKISARDGLEVPALMADLASDSLFGEANLIVVQEAQEFTTALGTALKEYLQHPNPHSVLVIEMNKLDGRTTLAQLAKRYGILVECKPLYETPKPWLRLPPWENDLVKWVCQRVRRYRKQIQPQVAYEITRLIGNRLFELAQEIDKLLLYIGRRKEITLADVQTMIKLRKRPGLFPLIDAISMRDLPLALQQLRSIFKEGVLDLEGHLVLVPDVLATMIIGTLHNRLKQLWTYHYCQEFPSHLPAFAQKKFREQSRAFSATELTYALQLLAETDYMLKTSAICSQFLIERLIIAIVGRA